MKIGKCKKEMLHNVIQTYNTISVIDWNIKINQALCVKTCNENEDGGKISVSQLYFPYFTIFCNQTSPFY